jgi:hypothetical protein
MKVISSLILGLITFNTFAGLLRVESNTFFAKRTGDDLNSETPLFEEFQTSYVNQEKKQQFNFDFGYSYDFSRSVYKLDLNQLNFQTDLAKSAAHLSVGRTFESFHLVKSSVVDSVAIDYKLFNDQVKTGVQLGLLRNYEFDKYSGKAPVYTWFTDYKSQEKFPMTFGLKFEHADYSDFSRSRYQTVKAVAKKEFENKEVYGNFQKGLSFSNSFRREVGINFYPRYDWTYGFSYQEFQKNSKEGFEQSIFNTFSMGKIHEYAASVGHTFSAKLYSGLSLMLDEYPVQKFENTRGYKTNWNLNYNLENLFVKGDVFYMKSFGGHAYGYNANGQYTYNDYLDLLLENEWVKYSKVTSEKNLASLIRFGGGTRKFKPFNVQVLSEVSSNNFYSEEWAFLVRLTFVDWREI